MPATVSATNQEVSSNGKTQQHQETCTHPGLFHVIRQGTPENFASKLVADKDYPKGSEIATLEGLTPGEKRYTTVQISKTHHIELNSDLVFMNHSCDPSAHMNVDSSNVTALKDIKQGDELTFFYPSTEWDMGKFFFFFLLLLLNDGGKKVRLN